MSYSKLIFQYMDGELDGVREDLLFTELARNPELRTDFNQHMKLDMASKQDMNTITAPAESTSAIFSSLGFSIPNEGLSPKPVTLQPSLTQTLANFWKRHMNIMMSAVSAVSVAVLAWGVSTTTPDVETVTALQTDVPASVEQIAEPAPVVPMVSNIASETVPPASASLPVVVEDNSEPDIDNTTATSPAIISASAARFNRYANIPAEMGKTGSGLNLAQILNEINLPVSNMSIMVGKCVNAAMNDQDIVGSGDILNDMFVSLFYGLNDYWMVGAEFGSADFNQRFSVPGSLGESYINKQNVQSFYAGGLIRYNLHQLSYKSFCPYMQTFLGANKYGPMAKCELGGIYKIAGWNLFLSAEYGQLFYSAYGNNYNSGNFGLKGGVSIDLTK